MPRLDDALSDCCRSGALAARRIGRQSAGRPVWKARMPSAGWGPCRWFSTFISIEGRIDPRALSEPAFKPIFARHSP